MDAIQVCAVLFLGALIFFWGYGEGKEAGYNEGKVLERNRVRDLARDMIGKVRNEQ